MFIFFSFMIIISSQSPIVPGQSNTSRSTSHFQSPRELWIKSWTRPTYSSSPNRIPTPRKNLLSFDLLCSQANSQPIIPSTTIHPTNRRDRMLALRNALFPSVLHAQEWFSWLFRAVYILWYTLLSNNTRQRRKMWKYPTTKRALFTCLHRSTIYRGKGFVLCAS